MLHSTEKSLRKGGWGEKYNECILEMKERGVVRHVPREELDAYNGVVNYLPYLPAFNPKNKSTPVRVVFDASRNQDGGPSLN